MASGIENLKEKDFIEKTKKGITVLDFWAPWCHACKALEPYLESLSKDLKEAKFYKVNVIDNPGLSSKMGVMSLPNILILNNGKVIDQVIGATSKKSLETKILKVLK